MGKRNPDNTCGIWGWTVRKNTGSQRRYAPARRTAAPPAGQPAGSLWTRRTTPPQRFQCWTRATAAAPAKMTNPHSQRLRIAKSAQSFHYTITFMTFRTDGFLIGNVFLVWLQGRLYNFLSPVDFTVSTTILGKNASSKVWQFRSPYAINYSLYETCKNQILPPILLWALFFKNPLWHFWLLWLKMTTQSISLHYTVPHPIHPEMYAFFSPGNSNFQMFQTLLILPFLPPLGFSQLYWEPLIVFINPSSVSLIILLLPSGLSWVSWIMRDQGMIIE